MKLDSFLSLLSCSARLEHELDFIMAQQSELKDLLTTLEEAVRTQQQGAFYSQRSIYERERTSVHIPQCYPLG